MTETSISVQSTLRNDRVIIALTAGLCLFLLVVVLKNVLLVPASQLSSDLILYIIIYSGFAVTLPLAVDEETGSVRQTMTWTGVIILITVAIMAVYAI